MDSVFLGKEGCAFILNQTRVGKLDVLDISESMQTIPVTALGEKSLFLRNGLM